MKTYIELTGLAMHRPNIIKPFPTLVTQKRRRFIVNKRLIVPHQRVPVVAFNPIRLIKEPGQLVGAISAHVDVAFNASECVGVFLGIAELTLNAF